VKTTNYYLRKMNKKLMFLARYGGDMLSRRRRNGTPFMFWLGMEGNFVLS
jgi:hypothetical protein